MKFSVSTYSFQRLVSNGSMTQFDCVSKAGEMGFDAIEFVGIHPHDGSSKEEYAANCGRNAAAVVWRFPTTR